MSDKRGFAPCLGSLIDIGSRMGSRGTLDNGDLADLG